MADLSNTARYPGQDFLQATPRNRVLGYIADLLAQSYSPERTQQMQGLSKFIGLPAVSDTLDRMSYGESLTTGAGGLGGTTKFRPNTIEAALAVAPLMPKFVKITEGLPVGASIKSVGEKTYKYPAQEALDLAQKRAALPVSEGGLGLPPDNTPMDRARAMGFNVDAYHGTYSDIFAFDPKYANTVRKTGVPEGTAAVVSSSPKIANSYAFDRTYLDFVPDYPTGANVIPLLINKGKNLSVSGKGMYWDEIQNKKYPQATTTNEIAEIAKKLGMDSATIKNVIDSAKLKVSKDKADTTFIFDPALIRSRFAAFDPFRKDVATALAMGVAAPNLLAAEKQQQKNIKDYFADFERSLQEFINTR